MTHTDLIIHQLRVERIAQGLSMRAVAKKMGVSNGSISDWESGIKSPTLRSLGRWADALKMQLKIQSIPEFNPAQHTHY